MLLLSPSVVMLTLAVAVLDPFVQVTVHVPVLGTTHAHDPLVSGAVSVVVPSVAVQVEPDGYVTLIVAVNSVLNCTHVPPLYT